MLQSSSRSGRSASVFDATLDRLAKKVDPNWTGPTPPAGVARPPEHVAPLRDRSGDVGFAVADVIKLVILLLIIFFVLLPMLRRGGCGGCIGCFPFFPFGGGWGGGGFGGGGGTFGGGGASGSW